MAPTLSKGSVAPASLRDPVAGRPQAALSHQQAEPRARELRPSDVHDGKPLRDLWIAEGDAKPPPKSSSASITMRQYESQRSSPGCARIVFRTCQASSFRIAR